MAISKHDLDEHLQLVTQRLTDRNLSRLELRDEIKQRRDLAGLNTPGFDDTVINAEINLLHRLIEDRAPPAQTPEERIAQAALTDPDSADILAHTLASNALKKSVADAQTQVNEALAAGRVDTAATARLAAAELALTEQQLPQFAMRLGQVRELHTSADRLDSEAGQASPEQAALLSAQAITMRRAARAISSGQTPPADEKTHNPKTDDDPNGMAAIIARAEEAVAASQAAG